MFAVVKAGGKQYKVKKDDIIQVNKLDAEIGNVVVFDEVIAVGDDKSVKLGEPTVKGFGVSAEVLEQKKDDKVIVFKKKRRHNYRRKIGHRQQLSVIKITDIGEGLKPSKGSAKPAAKVDSKAKPSTKDTAPKKAGAKKPAVKKETAKKASTATKKPAAKKKATAKKTDK